MTHDNTLEHPVPGAPSDQGQPNTEQATSDTPETDPTAGDHTDERRMRHRARAAEAERDTLAARLEGLQRAEVGRQLAEVLSVPDDLFELGGVQLADLVDPDTGAVDADMVTVAADALLEQRPGLAYVTPKPAPQPGTYQNAGQGRPYEPRPARTGWDRVLG